MAHSLPQPIRPSDPVEPDRELVARIAEGDAEALHALEARHAMSLYAVAYGALQDPEAADEAVAAAFARVRRMAPALRWFHGTVFAWLVAEVRGQADAAVLAPVRNGRPAYRRAVDPA